jgi:hypothetical protein
LLLLLLAVHEKGKWPSSVRIDLSAAGTGVSRGMGNELLQWQHLIAHSRDPPSRLLSLPSYIMWCLLDFHGVRSGPHPAVSEGMAQSIDEEGC